MSGIVRRLGSDAVANGMRRGAVLGLGGSGNTAIVTTAMRALPVGIPKVMVSTLASGNVAPLVGASDIMMMHAVADVAGVNSVTRKVIGTPPARRPVRVKTIGAAVP